MPDNLETLLIDFVQAVTTDVDVDLQTDLVAHAYLDDQLVADLVELVETEIGLFLFGDDLISQNFRTIECLAEFVEMKIAQHSFDRCVV